MCISREDKAKILAAITAPHKVTTRTVMSAILRIFDPDVPLVAASRRATPADMFGPEEKALSAEKVAQVLEWGKDGDLTVHDGEGNIEWHSAEIASEVAQSFYSTKGGKGKGGKSARPQRPVWEGDEKAGRPNAGNQRCYDCGSRFHAAGHPSCKEKSGMWSFAGLAVVAPEDEDLLEDDSNEEEAEKEMITF